MLKRTADAAGAAADEHDTHDQRCDVALSISTRISIIVVVLCCRDAAPHYELPPKIIQTLMKNVPQFVPVKNMKEIEAHITWCAIITIIIIIIVIIMMNRYLRYLYLQDEKKEVLRRWKSDRAHDDHDDVTANANAGDSGDHDALLCVDGAGIQHEHQHELSKEKELGRQLKMKEEVIAWKEAKLRAEADRKVQYMSLLCAYYYHTQHDNLSS